MQRGGNMRIVILGGSGMLGHKMWQFFAYKFKEVYATVRKDKSCYKGDIFRSENVIESLDLTDFKKVEKVLADISPDVVINCAGITLRSKESNSEAANIEINALLPHKLLELAKKNKVRLIHFSTDCVFDGEVGHYTEESMISARDIYGKTKAKGELRGGNALTLRSSFIGTELLRGSGLLEWFLAQSGTIKGYKRAIYSGFTALELCRIVEKLLVDYPKARGLYNVSSEPISKFDLLMLIKKKMDLDIEIIPDDNFFCDRSLDSSKFRKEFSYMPPSWEAMVDELANELKGRRHDF
jgi:dTDP-4-dehydrorhamnose reductase